MGALLVIFAVAAVTLAVLIWTGGGMVDPPVPEVVPLPGKLTVRPATRADIASILEISGEPGTMQANGWSPEALVNHQMFLEMADDQQLAKFLLGELESGQIATVGSFSYRPGTDEHSIGLQVRTECQGQGLGTEMMRALIMACQGSLDGPAWVGTATTNRPMQMVMERLGYSPEPGTEPFTSSGGEVFDSLWYDVGRAAGPPRMV